MNILLVEPDPILASTYIQALTNFGHIVTHVVSGQAAIMAADSQTPDIVILELQLTTNNGIAFLQEFRSYHEWQNIPVILHTYIPPTSYVTARDVLRREYGIKTWLYKPQTTLSQLASAVHRQGIEVI